MKKIYIIGTVGSGKTTYAKKLSEYSGIGCYELDNVVWKHQTGGDIKRSDEKIDSIFNEILQNDSWIIEGVNRVQFSEGLDLADTIIYFDLPIGLVRKNIIKRWLKQKFKIIESSYKPTIKMLYMMFVWSNKDYKDRENTLNNLKKYENKLIIKTTLD